MIKSILVFIVAFAIGLIGCAQVLWSMKKQQQRGNPLTIATSLAWVLIMLGIAALVNRYLPGQLPTVIVAYGVAFLVLLIAQLLQARA